MPLDKLPALLESGQWLAAIGLFDPLTAQEAARLAALVAGGNRKLLVIVLDAEDALLPAGARAALIASLREVHLVASAPPERWRCTIPANADVQIVEDREGSRARCAEFVRFVIDRQQAAATAAGRDD